MPEVLSIIFEKRNINFCFAAIIVLALHIRKLSKSEMYIVLILLISYFIDIGADLANALQGPHHSNHWVYNYSLPILYLAYILFYSYLLPNKRSFLRILYVCIFITLTHITFLIVLGVSNFLIYSIIPYLLLVGLAAFIYLQEIVGNEKIDLGKNLIFWFSIANVVKHIATIPVISTISWFSQIDNVWANNIYIINDYLSYYIYYSIIIFGVLWTKTIRA